jgi:hypothetical protein
MFVAPKDWEPSRDFCGLRMKTRAQMQNTAGDQELERCCHRNTIRICQMTKEIQKLRVAVWLHVNPAHTFVLWDR